jgi:hypothetical protein
MNTLTKILLLASIGCSSQTPEAPPAPVVVPAPTLAVEVDVYGWLSEAVYEPVTFRTLLSASPRGWEALRDHAYEEALSNFEDPTSQARALWRLMIFHGDMAQLTSIANEKLYTLLLVSVPGTDKPDGDTDTQTAADEGNREIYSVLATLSAYCSTQGDVAGWAGRVSSKTTGYNLVEAIQHGRAPWTLEANDVFTKRMRLHQTLRINGNADGFIASANRALLVERDDVSETSFFDPCVFYSLAEHWEARLARTLRGDDWHAMDKLSEKGLSARVYAPWLTGADLHTEILVANHSDEVGARSPSLRTLGLGTNPQHIDDVQNAKEEIASLDRGLTAWRSTILENATDDGKSILQEHVLFPQFRSSWLTTRGRQALQEGRPQQAGAYLSAVTDDDRVRVPPSTWVLRAEIALRAGDSATAKRHLENVLEQHPVAYSTVNTLDSILQTEQRIAREAAKPPADSEAPDAP